MAGFGGKGLTNLWEVKNESILPLPLYGTSRSDIHADLLMQSMTS